MPPKKVEAVGVTLDIPDQPPSLESDGIMEELLQKAKHLNVSAVEALMVQCLRLPNYRWDLRESVTVDFYVELILFASEQGFGPKKTLNVVHWANEVRKVVEGQPENETRAREMVKDFFVQNIERYLREASLLKQDEVASLEAAASTVAGGAPAGKGPAAPPVAAKPNATQPPKAGVSAGNPPDSGKSSQHYENPYLSVAEVAPLAQFISRGLLQHAQLYANIAKNCRPPAPSTECPKTFTFSVEQPIRPLPLSRALTAQEVEAIQKDLDAKAQEELERLQAEEAAVLEAARLQEEARLEQERQLAAEDKANQLYFSKAGSGPAVAIVEQEVVAALTQRQQDILHRIAKLEADLSVVMGK